MTTFELLLINKGLLEVMSTVEVGVSDIKYIPLYQEYEKLSKEGHKNTYIIQYLSDEYGISSRNIYRIIGKFSNLVNF